MAYTAGLHILSEIRSNRNDLLSNYFLLKPFLSEKIDFYDLHKVGEVFHSFDGAGFTGVVCLTESHIALHTWPEFQLLTLDIYLSNNQKHNNDKARNFYKDILQFFESYSNTTTELLR